MDRAITATEANQRFSELLREVAEGNSFTVTSRGRPVARMVPIEREDLQQQKERTERLLALLRTLPVRYSGEWTRSDLYD